MVGSLAYASVTTRIDISFAINLLSRFLNNPYQIHLRAANHVFKYLASTSNLAMIFGKATSEKLTLSTYCDASFGNDLIDRKSTTGAIFIFNGDLISWVSKKQNTVATSSGNAEYIAISTALTEMIWYQSWLQELLDKFIPITIFTDSMVALHVAQNDSQHKRMKHIDIRHHFIRDEVQKNNAVIKHVSTHDQLADMLTKSLPTIQFKQAVSKLLVPVSA